MLSICIPVYNYDVTRLVSDLHKQLAEAGQPFEILLMDDASQQEYREKNKALQSDTIRYIQLDTNIGRSRIRNRLAQEARHPYLIFMDCDSAVPSASYIRNYLDCCRPMVVCYGGRVYEPQPPDDDTFFRWKYGVARESCPAAVRSRNPNFGFCTNNFLIDKQVFTQVGFDEELEGYGHEDTLFGLELLHEGIPIEHIDNPLIHLGLEDAREFLAKTENSVLNLYRMDKLLRQKYPSISGYSKLIRTRDKLKRLGLVKPMVLIFSLARGCMKRNLLGKNPSLFIMDVYKLGLLCRVAG